MGRGRDTGKERKGRSEGVRVPRRGAVVGGGLGRKL